MPETLDVCAFMKNMGKMGVYVGNGGVIEAMGPAQSGVKVKLNGRG